MITLILTEQEAMALRQMIDAAVRAHGIKAAEAGLYLDMKLAKAMEAVHPAPVNGGSQTAESHP